MIESSPEKWTFRSAQKADAVALSDLALRSKAYWGYSESFIENCRNELTVSDCDITDQKKIVQVLESCNRVVGFSMMERISDRTWDLDALFIDPLFIGKGAGRALFEQSKMILTELGAENISIQSDPNAVEFYHSMGCIAVGEKESGSIPGRFLPLLVFRLPE